VVGCTTGYKFNNEKMSMFKVPNNSQDVNKWGLAKKKCYYYQYN
jgi:hypothetical protein